MNYTINDDDGGGTALVVMAVACVCVYVYAIFHVIPMNVAFKTKYHIIILYSHHVLAYINSLFNLRLTLPFCYHFAPISSFLRLFVLFFCLFFFFAVCVQFFFSVPSKLIYSDVCMPAVCGLRILRLLFFYAFNTNGIRQLNYIGFVWPLFNVYSSPSNTQRLLNYINSFIMTIQI